MSGRPWTAHETRTLQRMLDARTRLPTIAATLGRTEAAVAWRARHVLSAEPNRGLETIASAARRSGYSHRFLRDVILPWSEVPTCRSNLTKASRGRVRLVDPVEVDRAVESFVLSAERAVDAARRLGAHPNTVRNRAARAGLRACHGYFRTSDLDALFPGPVRIGRPLAHKGRPR